MLPFCSGCASAPQPISYTFTTSISLSPSSGIRVYEKIRSASSGYADLMGFVVSDPTVLSELAPSTFYSFLSGTPAAPGGGYITDASMTSPEACEAYCNGAPTCSTFYYQYEFTNSSRMVAASIEPRWMHKCQLNL